MYVKQCNFSSKSDWFKVIEREYFSSTSFNKYWIYQLSRIKFFNKGHQYWILDYFAQFTNWWVFYVSGIKKFRSYIFIYIYPLVIKHVIFCHVILITITFQYLGKNKNIIYILTGDIFTYAMAALPINTYYNNILLFFD